MTKEPSHLWDHRPFVSPVTVTPGCLARATKRTGLYRELFGHQDDLIFVVALVGLGPAELTNELADQWTVVVYQGLVGYMMLKYIEVVSGE